MMTLGSSGGFSAFAAELRQQSRLEWRTELTAPVINPSHECEPSRA